MAKLILSMDGLVLKEIPLSKERMSIGRKASNDIQIDNLAISGEHAAVVTILNDSFLEDLNSTNGTLVNGQPAKKHFLKNGDVNELPVSYTHLDVYKRQHQLRQLLGIKAFRDARKAAHVREKHRQFSVFSVHAVAFGIARHFVNQLGRHILAKELGKLALAACFDEVAPGHIQLSLIHI